MIGEDYELSHQRAPSASRKKVGHRRKRRSRRDPGRAAISYFVRRSRGKWDRIIRSLAPRAPLGLTPPTTTMFPAAEDMGNSVSPVSSLSSIALPLMCVSASDSPLRSAIGLSASNRLAMMVWHRSKAKISRLLTKPDTAHESACHLPQEIIEIIIAHLTRDLTALKACSLTCRSWYIAAVIHIHHTIHLRDQIFDTARRKLRPLSKLHELGLIHLVKEIRVGQLAGPSGWFGPEAFNPNNLTHFSSFTNVHTLRIQGLNLDRFMPGIGHYFHQFSPTLRTISLYYPTSSAPRQLSQFLSLFPNLDDIDIRRFITYNIHIPDSKLGLFSAPKLRGQLTLHDFLSAETWEHLIAGCGGLRFRQMVLRNFGSCSSILFKACAETLETLRFYLTDDPGQ